MKLGQLSAKYESNGNPGAVSTGYGDAGGISYGTYQLASNAGSVTSFVNWLNTLGHPAGNILNKYAPGNRDFAAAWIYCADNLPDFSDLQHDYIKYSYYDPTIKLLADAGFHIANHHPVMRDVIWSRAVQYGTGNIVEMFEAAVRMLGYPHLSYVDAPNFDAAMIRAIYLDVCKTPEWTNGSPALRAGLYARFDSECADALASL